MEHTLSELPFFLPSGAAIPPLRWYLYLGLVTLPSSRSLEETCGSLCLQCPLRVSLHPVLGAQRQATDVYPFFSVIEKGKMLAFLFPGGLAILKQGNAGLFFPDGSGHLAIKKRGMLAFFPGRV